MIRLYNADLVYDKKIPKDTCKLFGDCDQLESKALLKTGVYSFRVRKPGVYYFLYKNDENRGEIITITAPSSPKDHKLIITDTEGIPNVLNIHPEDRVWFTWDDSKRAHNIRQVNHQNQIITDGFLSGALMESPATFVQSFEELGIFYYRSDNSKGILGAIVVVPEPQIEHVYVDTSIPDPDPVRIRVNDVVIWEFNQRQSTNLVLISSNEDFQTYEDKVKQRIPTTFISKSFKDPGVFHFLCPPYLGPRLDTDAPNYIISTVIVDIVDEHETVFLDAEGFFPDVINVKLVNYSSNLLLKNKK